jgi:hypothetical protein
VANVFQCPRCTKVSYNPSDARFGYCARCNAFTDPERSLLRCPNRDCGQRVQVLRLNGARFAQHDTLRGLQCPESLTTVPELAT